MSKPRRISLIISILFVVVFTSIFFWNKRKHPPKDAGPELVKARIANQEEARLVFSQPLPPTPEQVAEFSPLLEKLGKAIQNRNLDQVNSCINSLRFADECERAGTLEKMGYDGTPWENRQVLEGISTLVGPTFLKNPGLFAWEKVEIRRVRISTDSQEAIVTASHINESSRDPRRWWLTKKSGEWQIFDFEELRTSSRLTLTLSEISSPEISKLSNQFFQASRAIALTYKAVLKNDFIEAEKAIIPLRQATELTNSFLAIRAILEGSLALGRADARNATIYFDEAERLDSDMPMIFCLRAAANLQLKKYEECLENCKKYLDNLGEDTTIFLFRGIAEKNLNQTADAINSYKRCLNIDANDLTCLSSLRIILPRERKKEWVEIFNKSTFRDNKQLLKIAKEAESEADFESLDAIATMMRKIDSDDGDAIYFKVKVAAERKDKGICLKLLKESYAIKGEAKESTRFKIAYLLAQMGLFEEIYETSPDEYKSRIFQMVAGIQIELMEGTTPNGNLKARERLSRLIESHRKKSPSDYWILFYEGELLDLVGLIEEAKKLYEKAFSAIPAKNDYHLTIVLNRLLSTMYRQKLGLDAYSKYGPSAEVFDFLANQHFKSNDFPGLKKLIDMHSAKDPKDPNLLYWTGRWNWHHMDYASAVTSFRAYSKAATDIPNDKPNYHLRANSDRIRGLVLLGQFDNATNELKSMKNERDDLLEIIIAAASGDVEATIDAIKNTTAEKSHGTDFLYKRDAYLAEILRGKKMKPVRDKYPEAR